jgi:hypothetical protein
MPTWRLRDADPIAAEHPYTFYKPSRELIAKVTTEETVKLIFDFDSEDPEAPGAERMWVIVDKVLGDGGFVGRLDNEPRWIKDLAAGDRVTFWACHIVNTEHDDNDNLVEKYTKRCYVTNRVLLDGCNVGYLYREEPDREDDSGWRITANDESQEYMDHSENIAFVSLGAVLSRDDSFRELLDSPVGSAFIRDARTGKVSVRRTHLDGVS